MKANDLRLDELVSFSDGLISLHGRRLILHDINAMEQFRGDLIALVGLDQARGILSRFGYFWGQADAAAMKRIFEWDDVNEWLLAFPRLLALQGVARTVVESLEYDSEGHLKMEVTWQAAAEAEEHLSKFGISPDAGCPVLAGYASGYTSFCLGSQIFFVERTCRSRGDRSCQALGQDQELWGEEASDSLKYFQADDIRGKVARLSDELKTQAKELERERKKVQELQSRAHLGLAEIKSKAFQQVLDLSARVARFDTSILLTGESGVGKEVLANFIHQQSHRSKGSFIAVNCGSIPETLLESELFGHKAGSFTGANRDRLGLFEEAQGGTIFLDEIGDISPEMQVKLLRVLQEKEVRRVGENRMRAVDVRVIAATHRQLEEEVREHRFRDDLFYRLRVVEIRIPPLRERPEDILPLARFIIQRLSKRLKLPKLTLDATILDYLMGYPWPGNVRELENALERAAVVSEDRRLHPKDLPDTIHESYTGRSISGGTLNRTLAEVERNHVLRVLNETGGNRSKAAETLGIGNTTLWRKLKEWGEQR